MGDDKTFKPTDLHGVVEDLMFVFLDADDVLKHLVQLLLAEYRLRRGRLPLLRPLARVFVAATDLVELGHPRADDRLLDQIIYKITMLRSGLAVGRWTCDLQVAGSIPGRWISCNIGQLSLASLRGR